MFAIVVVVLYTLFTCNCLPKSSANNLEKQKMNINFVLNLRQNDGELEW